MIFAILIGVLVFALLFWRAHQRASQMARVAKTLSEVHRVTSDSESTKDRIGIISTEELCIFASRGMAVDEEFFCPEPSERSAIQREADVVHYAAVDLGVKAAAEQHFIEQADLEKWNRLRATRVCVKVAERLKMTEADLEAASAEYQKSESGRGLLFARRSVQRDDAMVWHMGEMRFAITAVAVVKAFKGELRLD